ncbi:hypothetical protein P879_05806 [Paragonimus westermani]|uniref:Helicase ATP-binding domain-containing protein n=1 Tax=Paragonimus westermani TaxID=34504 RepID=A0A8T0DQR9_9TREM|nr:hypothetical protein P879_05806 [Paragonimus westermani]
MRAKPIFPQFLSSKRRQLQSFCFHFRAKQQSIESELPKIGQAKKRKLLISEERKLMHTYPHYIYLLRDAAPEDLLLQTVSLPVDTPMITVLQACQKPVLYFNSTEFVLVWRDDQSIREYVSETGDAVIPLLFAASSSLLDVYYRVVNECLHLDICIKPRCIESTSLQSTHLISQTQYEKIHNFLTLQCMLETSVTMMPDFSVFLRTRHSETQAEFVTLIKLLYDCAQTRHNNTHCVWDVISSSSIQHADLLTQLRPYQIDAVKWMSYQESHISQVDLQSLHRAMFWPVPLASSTQREVYFSLMTGTFVDQLPTFQPPCLGGILADEMGLGKTLELIALILLHPWSDWSVSGGHLRNLDGELCSAVLLDYDAPTPPMIQDDRQCRVLCSCGNVDETRDFPLVQCTRCDGPRQHAVCVQYDPSTFMDRLPIEHGYICPQCWSHVVTHRLEGNAYRGPGSHLAAVERGTAGARRSWLSRRSCSTNVNPYAPRTRVTALRTAASQPEQMEEELLLPGFVQPGQLACADIVLTSYSVVQRELDWAEVVAERRSGLGHRPGLRLEPRYLCRPSPLTCVRWWRVCLDEAQMVERITSKTARMMSQIDAKHRWCVTGTPAEKSIDDLYGLFAYLRFEPFSIRHYWHCLLYQPFLATTAPSWPTSSDCTVAHPTLSAVQSTRLADMLSMVLWRNTKALVGDQLALPPITEQIHWIDFTPVERYIHDRVLAQSAGALDRLSRTMCISPEQPLASLPGAAHWRLVYLITRLRQACTHASLVVATGASSRRMRANSRQTDANRHKLGHGPELGDVDDDDDMYHAGPAALSSSTIRDGPSVSAARAHRNFGTGCFTMTEVVRRVVDDTRRECEGLLRSWVFNKNGAAGCFIIKQQYDLAAECYRDVLRTTDTLERNHGVLADWSQRLHAITNLNWLIQSRGVPLLDEPPPPTVESGDPRSLSDGSAMELDPRVDRDLLAKAERLRSAYIQMHSHLLARVHENLEPVVTDLDAELDHSVTPQDGIDNFEDASVSSSSHLTYPYGAGWLTWFSDAIQFLVSCGVGPNLIEMLVASFQGKPGANRSGYRTTLLHAGSVNSFKALLLTEVVGVFQARKRLREAMQPVMSTWRSFKAGEEADPKILQPFYSCCARTSTEATEDVEQKEFEKSEQGSGNPSSASKNLKTKKEARELKQLIEMAGSTREARQKKKVRTRCAYCVALRALSNYQAALNHERLKSSTQAMVEQEFDDQQSIEIGSGLVLGNPLLVALTIVCHQTTKLVSKAPVANNPSIGKDWPSRARRFEALFRQMGKEVMLTSRTLSLTKEWWNIHDDTEQFVVRLQATCPTDLAFIHSHEVSTDSILSFKTGHSLLKHLTIGCRLVSWLLSTKVVFVECMNLTLDRHGIFSFNKVVDSIRLDHNVLSSKGLFIFFLKWCREHARFRLFIIRTNT